MVDLGSLLCGLILCTSSCGMVVSFLSDIDDHLYLYNDRMELLYVESVLNQYAINPCLL